MTNLYDSSLVAKESGEQLAARTAPTGDATGESVKPYRRLDAAQAAQSARVKTGRRWFESILLCQFRGGSSVAERRVNNPSVPALVEEGLVASEGCKPKTLAGLPEPSVESGVQNMHEVKGSSPFPRPISKIKPFQFRWREALGKIECPYAHRTLLNLGLFSIRLHEWHRSDDKRFFHDHPWHFVTLVLRGSYTDVSAAGRDRLTVGSLRFRHAGHAHYVEVPVGGCTTIIVTSRVVRNWGFWVKGKFVRPLRFFGKFGHPPCNDQ